MVKLIDCWITVRMAPGPDHDRDCLVKRPNAQKSHRNRSPRRVPRRYQGYNPPSPLSWFYHAVAQMTNERAWSTSPSLNSFVSQTVRFYLLGLILHGISCCAPVGRHTGMESVSSASIPSWDPTPAGLVLKVISMWKVANPSRYIKTKAELGLGVVRIRPKNDADLHKRGTNGARYQKSDRYPSGS